MAGLRDVDMREMSEIEYGEIARDMTNRISYTPIK